MLKNRIILFVGLIAFSLATHASYECVGVDDCQQRWWRAMSWLKENAKFKVKLKGENVLEAKAKTPAHKNRLEYRLEKKDAGEGRWAFEAQASCRVATGCPSAEKKLAMLFAYISSPLAVGQGVNADSLQSTPTRPIQKYIKQQGCDERSPVHELRVSWAGQLFEVECISPGKQREALVVRCRAEQCRSLK